MYTNSNLESIRKDMLNYGLSFEDTYQDAPFHDTNWQLIRYKGNKKAFLWTYEKDGYINLNVKVDPDKAYFWRNAYKSVIPGYHQNKMHWNTVILDGSIPDKDVKLMIAESYDLVTDTPTKRIYEAVKKIPKGKVATYADVAELAGDRKMARAVGNALHKNPDPSTIPCHRVVNSKGELAGEYAFGGAWKQAQILESEGVEIIDGKVNLEKYRI
jgi:O-6-methylguanine DNA methyltransferase